MSKTQTRAWAQGIIAGAISAFSTGMVAALTMPNTFDVTSEGGWSNLAKITIVPAALSIFHKLSQSPLPGFMLSAGDTVTAKNPSISADGVLTADSATIQKAGDAQ